MGTRYYKFFAILRMAIKNKKLECSAPGNKNVHLVLALLREKGLIGGFCLDFSRIKDTSGYWHGYPRYKVFIKYNYYGLPVIKKIDCFKTTKTNFTLAKDKKTLFRYSNYWLTSQKGEGIRLLTSPYNSKLLARFQV